MWPWALIRGQANGPKPQGHVGILISHTYPVAVHLQITNFLSGTTISGLWIILGAAVALGLVAACGGIVRHHILNVDDWREPPAQQPHDGSDGTDASLPHDDIDEVPDTYAKGQPMVSKVCLTVSASSLPGCGDSNTSAAKRLSFGGALRKLAGNVFVVGGADDFRGEIERIECSEDSLVQPRLRQRALDNEFKGRK